ncbi:MAG TPA: hypothetical protein VH914_09580 [Acidimicrobiia bacterium]|nr:hypothetical protein [Acidimicrobiia bacterium]
MRAVGLVLAVLLLAACHGSSTPHASGPKSTAVNPGPNSTVSDPGPNNTASGPQTLQGTLVARDGCFELDGNAAHQPKTHYELTFVDVVVQRGTDKVVIEDSDGKRTVGPRDTVYVAGHPASGRGPCGRNFNVDKVVAVIPAN